MNARLLKTVSSILNKHNQKKATSYKTLHSFNVSHISLRRWKNILDKSAAAADYTPSDSGDCIPVPSTVEQCQRRRLILTGSDCRRCVDKHLEETSDKAPAGRNIHQVLVESTRNKLALVHETSCQIVGIADREAFATDGHNTANTRGLTHKQK